MADKNDILKGTLTGRAFYPFLNKPQKDVENNREDYKLDLVLTNEDGTPLVVKDKKTGETINMLERAKSLNLIIKEETKNVPGTYVRIKRTVRIKDDGSKTVAPEVKHMDGTDLSTTNVGNESLVKVEFSAIPISKGVGKGKNTAYLNKVVVYKLVPYVSKIDEDEFEFPDEVMETKPTAKGTVSNDNTLEVDMDIEE